MVNLTISGSRNPLTGRQTPIYIVQVKDKDGFVKASMNKSDETNAMLTMQKPHPISEFTYEPVDKRQTALTAFQIDWTSTMPYPRDAYFEVKLDSTQIGPKDAAARANVKCSTNLQLTVRCTFVTDDLIKVEGAFVEDLPRNSRLQFIITNFYINVEKPMTTTSWQLTTFTPGGHFIDTIDNGLNLTYKCHLPCLTCNGKACTSCNTLTGLTILYDSKCYKTCPASTFHDESAFTCKKCHETCAECDQKNGDHCTKCDTKGVFKFLDGKACKPECPFGYYGDLKLGKCMPCAAPCQSCSGSATNCETCDITAKLRYLMGSTCKDKCDPGHTVPLGNSDYVCKACSDNCETCVAETDHCLTCKTQKPFLSLRDNTCHD